MVSSSSPTGELEEELKDAGNKLLKLPSSVIELLSLLEEVEDLLWRVEQAPSRSMQDALLPVMKALISQELLRHSEINVTASVVSCIHEITRITAPEAPYDDDAMKEIFKLTVMLLEKLSLASGHCYTKAVSILDTMAKVKSCSVMLDIEVDELIVEMFQLFFNVIRPHLPISVFLAMEAVMTLVINEIEEIPLELLNPLLTSVKKGNQNVSPLSCKLGENVFKKCAAKLKPYLPEGLRLTGSDVNDFAEIVSSICQDASGRESVAKEPVPDASHGADDSPSVDGSARSIMNNGSAQVKGTYILGEENTRKTLENCSSKTRDSKSKNHYGNFNSSTAHNEDKSASLSQNHSFLDGTHGKRGRPKKKKDPINLDGDASKESSGKKQVSFSASRSQNEGESELEEFSKMNGKRKRSSQKEEVSEMPRDIRQYGEELVGCRVKVWWPLDQTFYQAAIYSFNPVQKMHRILYADGDEEFLDLSKEQWALVGENNLPEQGDISETREERENEEQKSDGKLKTSVAINKSKFDKSRSSKNQGSRADGESRYGKSKQKKTLKTSSGEVRKGKLPDSVDIQESERKKVLITSSREVRIGKLLDSVNTKESKQKKVPKTSSGEVRKGKLPASVDTKASKQNKVLKTSSGEVRKGKSTDSVNTKDSVQKKVPKTSSGKVRKGKLPDSVNTQESEMVSGK